MMDAVKRNPVTAEMVNELIENIEKLVAEE